MDDVDDICCSVEKWCLLVDHFSDAQRAALFYTGRSLHGMLQIPSVLMRTNLIRFLVEAYDSQKNKFILKQNLVEITLTADDVYAIFGYENVGLDIMSILAEEGSQAMRRVPKHFLSTKTGNLVIDDLIAQIMGSDSSDEEFIQKAILVLIGTVIAPSSTRIIPKGYYALVEHVDRIPTLNWNAFTLQFCMESLRFVKGDRVKCILGNRVKCIPIYLVPLESQYSRRW